MEKAIKRIKKKFTVMASVICFSIIALMIIILNLLMSWTYKNENQIVTDMIFRTAIADISSESLETFDLKTADKIFNGNLVVPVNINNVSRVILHGDISIDDEDDVEWYCGGGGIMFNFQNSENEIMAVHKEYVFNKDDTSITVDFSDFDDVIYNAEYISLENGKIIGDNLIISDIWWTASSRTDGNDEGISINLKSLEVVYKNGLKNENSQNYIQKRNFNDIFEEEIPDSLNSISSFYILTDKNKNITEINYGNLINKIPDDEIYNCVHEIFGNNDTSGNIKVNDNEYSYKIKSSGDINAIVFTYNGTQSQTMKNLLIISISVGIFLMIILFIIITLVSNNVINPLKTAFEKQKQFISNASHELKTPVTVISATADLLENQVDDDRLINCIKEQSDKMNNLIHELLTLARLSEMNHTDKKFSNFNISNTVKNTVLYFECRAYEENRIIESDTESDLTFYGDENQISRLVSILVDNALKYSTQGSTIMVSLKSSKNKIILECSNYCEKPENFDINKIFERFYRSEKVHSNDKKGFGLGLSIAQSIVEHHNGTINVSEKNNIIKFSIIFPI